MVVNGRLLVLLFSINKQSVNTDSGRCQQTKEHVKCKYFYKYSITALLLTKTSLKTFLYYHKYVLLLFITHITTSN